MIPQDLCRGIFIKAEERFLLPENYKFRLLACLGLPVNFVWFGRIPNTGLFKTLCFKYPDLPSFSVMKQDKAGLCRAVRWKGIKKLLLSIRLCVFRKKKTNRPPPTLKYPSFWITSYCNLDTKNFLSTHPFTPVPSVKRLAGNVREQKG